MNGKENGTELYIKEDNEKVKRHKEQKTKDYFIRDFVFGSDRVSCAVFLDAFQFL